MNINELAKRIHTLNAKWWIDLETGKPIQRNIGELLALVVSELAEALEGERKNLMDDHLPHRRMPEVEMADAAIRLMDFAAGFKFPLGPVDSRFAASYQLSDNRGEAIFQLMTETVNILRGLRGNIIGFVIGNRITDVLRLIEAYCVKFGYDLWPAIEEKLKYNQTRADHTLEARRAAGGKAF